MATITSAGGVLDVNTLVSQLVAAEQNQRLVPITRKETQATTQISALGALKGALSAFKSALEPLKTVSAFETRKATVADTDFYSASADGTAAAGHYDIEVVNVAQAHQLASDEFLGGSTANVGYGTLTISVGGKSFDVELDAEHATLADVRNAINSAKDNTGVQATLLNGTGGARLVLTSAKTGEAQTIDVVASGGDGGLDQLATANLTEMREAKDAEIKIADFSIKSTTNTFKNAIDGVTITVKKATLADEPVGLDVALDTTSITSRIQKFVTEYNSMQGTLSKLGSYDAATKVAGPLVGDALLRGAQDQARRDLSDPVKGIEGTYTTLASVGITTSDTGALKIDTDKLNAAIDADPQAVAKLFGSDTGVAARMYKHLDDRLSTSGDIETRNKSLNNEIKALTKDKETLALRLQQIETRYRKQFVALDSLLTQMQSTSSYLAQQLANLPK
jgi:flagellar hook-associated protein 2